MTGVAETPGGIPAILPFDVAALRAAKQLQQHEPSATRLGPKSSPRATHAAQRITTHTLTGSSRPRLALLRRRDHGVLGWRPLRFTTRPSSHPPTQGSHGRGTGVLAPRRLASPQSLSCAIQHVYSLDFTTTQAVAASLFSPALVQCKANSGGRSRIQRAVLAESIRCLFSLIDNGVSHGRNGGALPNAPNVDGSTSTHVS